MISLFEKMFGDGFWDNAILEVRGFSRPPIPISHLPVPKLCNPDHDNTCDYLLCKLSYQIVWSLSQSY